MQKESSSKKELVMSLYTDEEIEGVSTTSSVTKNDSTLKGEVNISEVSSTSEENNQLPSSSSRSIFMDLYEENIVDSGSDNVKVNAAFVDKTKPKLGLSLLGEYADSGNDTEEEIRNSLIAKVKKPSKKTKKTADISAVKNSTAELAVSKEVSVSNETSNKLESGVSEVSRETCLSDDKISLTEEKGDDFSDFDIHAMLDDSLAKVEKIKEEGQLSVSDSSDSERSSDGKKDSKKLKEDRKDKSKKKDRKKKKKKRKKQKQVVVEKKDPSESKGKYFCKVNMLHLLLLNCTTVPNVLLNVTMVSTCLMYSRTSHKRPPKISSLHVGDCLRYSTLKNKSFLERNKVSLS